MKRITVLLILLPAAVSLFAQNQQARIREVTGSVEIKRPGSENWTPAKAGDSLGASTMISTGLKSNAVLSVGSSVITVRPLTRMSIDNLVSQGNSETIEASIKTGRIRTDVKPPSGGKTSLTVQSPSATASVRGTAFEMDTVSIQVSEGAVSYGSKNADSRPVTVSAGQRAAVDASGKVVGTAAAADAAIDLPALPGETDSSKLRLGLGSGNIEIDIILTPK